MKTTSNVLSFQIHTTFDSSEKYLNTESTFNNRSKEQKNLPLQINSPTGSFAVNLKEGLYGTNRLSDCHFKASLRDSCSDSKRLRLKSNQIQYCMDTTADQAPPSLNHTSKKSISYQIQARSNVLAPVSPHSRNTESQIQKVRGIQITKLIPQSSPGQVLRTCPDEIGASFHSPSKTECFEINSIRKKGYSRSRFVENKGPIHTEPEPEKTSLLHKFALMENFCEKNLDYEEEGFTSRFPMDKEKTVHCARPSDINMIIAQENTKKIEIRPSREKNFLAKMRSL